MHCRMLIGIVVLLQAVSTAALAQNTLGEVLDAGGKKLSKAELLATLGGASIVGPTSVGGEIQADFKTDGTFSGSLKGAQGRAGGIFGTWTVDDSGKMCTEFTTSLGQTGARKDASCGFYFKSGDQYYLTSSDSNRGAIVLKRVLKK